MLRSIQSYEFAEEGIQSNPYYFAQINHEDHCTAASKREEDDNAVAYATKEFSKRIKIEFAVAGALMVLVFFGILLICRFDLDMFWAVGLFVTVAALYSLCIVKLRIGLCPYCETFVGRGKLFVYHCPNCGGRLRQ